MRYPRLHKRLSREKIVRTAARAFNRHGFNGIGIADIMKEAGLTQGAFSGHFSSKDELIREAIDDAFSKNIFLENEGENRSMDDLLGEYLSGSHRDDIEEGCAASSLTAEVSRLPRRTRESFLIHVRQVLRSIRLRLPENIRGPNRDATAISIFALLLGSIQLARASRGTKLSEAVIEAATKGARHLASGQHAAAKSKTHRRPGKKRRI
jgi:TetR/AcrR family transcriptional regulator, transcriptional repressor for nem operon